MASVITSATGQPSGGILSFLGNTSPTAATSLATTAPKAQTTTPAVAPALSTPAPVAPANPNAAAINKAHTATLAALSSGSTGGITQSLIPPPSTAAPGMTSTDPFAITDAQKAAGLATNPISSNGLVGPQTASTDTTGASGSIVHTNQTPYSASNPPTTSPGILGAGLGQAQGYYDSQQGLTDESKALLAKYNAQEAASTNQFNGTASDEAGHNAQLENLANTGVARIESEQGKQASYESPLAILYGQGASDLLPGNINVTPPAGAVTTNTATGQQYSNPTYQPIGQTVAVSPQPNGTPGQPATAGQASQYVIKSGDTLNAIATANGISEAALAAANPNAVPTNLQIGGTLTIPAGAGSTGSPFTAGVVSGQNQLGTQYAQNYSAYQQAEAIRTNINSIIGSNPQLNPSSFTDVNSALQFLNGKVSNPAYSVLANNVAEYVNTLAPILGVGGDTTNYKTQLAQQFLNGAASGQSMSQIMAGIAQTAALKLQQQQSAGGSTGSVSAPAPSTGSSGTPMFGSFN